MKGAKANELNALKEKQKGIVQAHSETTKKLRAENNVLLKKVNDQKIDLENLKPETSALKKKFEDTINQQSEALSKLRKKQKALIDSKQSMKVELKDLKSKISALENLKQTIK